MLRLLFASVLFLSIGAAAQTARQADPVAASTGPTVSLDIPEAPSAIAGRPEGAGDTPELSEAGFVSSTPANQKNTDSSPRTLDRRFILLQALSAMALVADVETTVRDLQGQTIGELNPLFGQHPTRARLYGMNVPLNILTFYVSYHYKKSQPSRNLWKVAPAVSIAVHTGATVNNLIVAH